jgi:hypothetical protein
MEQRSAVLVLRLKSLLKKALRDALVAVLQENAVSYSSLRRFYYAGRLLCREAIVGLNSEEASSAIVAQR